MLAPVSSEHDDYGFWLRYVLQDFADEHDLGIVNGSEFMVRFGRQRKRRIPDILFVAKSRIGLIKRNHFEGAPDLIMETISPDSISRDWQEKYLDYERAGYANTG